MGLMGWGNVLGRTKECHLLRARGEAMEHDGDASEGVLRGEADRHASGLHALGPRLYLAHVGLPRMQVRRAACVAPAVATRTGAHARLDLRARARVRG